VAIVSPPRAPEAAPPSDAFRLEKAPVLLPASAVVLFRGADGDSLGNDLQQALAPYRSDHYEEAALAFERLAREYPQSTEASFYLGICRLFLNANEEAAGELEKAQRVAKPPLADQASWYLALAYHRLGRDGDALPLLNGLCRGAGKDADRACLGLRALK
jgi:TolA-binding protein